MLLVDANRAMDGVYKSYRRAYIAFVKNKCDDKEVIIDSFQEAVIALYENIIEGKVEKNNSTVKTYLFAIGKNILINKMKHESRYAPIQDSFITENDNSLTEIPQHVAKAFSQLGDSCQKILTLFYYRRYSIESIAQEMDMKNTNSVKANKSRCLKKLKQLANQKNTDK